jgi:hypothetical protein
MALHRIVLIGQSDFNGAGRSHDRRNDLAGIALVVGAHSHHSNEVHSECEIFHGGANSPHHNTAVAHLKEDFKLDFIADDTGKAVTVRTVTIRYNRRHAQSRLHRSLPTAVRSRRSHGLDCAQYLNLWGLRRIEDSCHTANARRDLLEYLQPLKEA